MAGSSLASLQSWMQDRVTAGTWSADRHDADIRAVVVSSAGLPAETRVGIYASSYVARLAECMRTEFPVLRALIGDQVFNLFVGGYLSARPSASYSLYDLGAGFTDYLEATRPQPHSGPGTPEALPASLARLERAMAEADRADGPENDARERGAFDALSVLCNPELRLRTPGSLKLLRLDFDFTEALAAARQGGRPQMPAPRDSLVAVARVSYRVHVHTLDLWAFAWLAALAENGGDVQAANQAAARASGRDGDTIVADFLAWLPSAVERGFVT
jgi:Putative DNA-binding domain